MNGLSLDLYLMLFHGNLGQNRGVFIVTTPTLTP
jgi:hypothetical protein